MKNIFNFLFLLVTCLNLQAQDNKKVLFIGIDGTRPDALEFASTPNMDALITDGIYTPDALNDDITSSGPGWSAMLTGVWSDKHGVTDNSFSGSNYEDYPSIFKRIEDFNSDLHTVSFVHWNEINDFITLDHADFKTNYGSDLEVGEAGSNYLTSNDPDLMFLHFDDVDHAGHASGYSVDVPEYITAIESVDVHIGTVLTALQARENYEEEDWLILVSTDHGGLGFGHGGNSIDEERIFMIASGKNVATEVILAESITVSDVPENCLDEETELNFAGNGDIVQVEPNQLFDFGENQDFTIECRVRTSQAADVSIVGNKDWDSGGNPGFVISFRYASGPEWKVNIGDGESRVDIETGGEIADNEWHTLSVTFDRDGLMTMYEDGIEIASDEIAGIGDIDTGAGLVFGSDILGDYSYNGAIAEVRVWNEVLSAEAVADYACNSIDDAHPHFNSLSGYWKMNEGMSTVADFSPNGNNGLSTGAEWNIPDSITSYDYSNTPRTPDMAVSALTWLCVPISPDWNLDGQSLVAECMPSATNDLILNAPALAFVLSPNPALDMVYLTFENEFELSENQVSIRDVLGRVVFRGESNILRINTLMAGVYTVSVKSGNKTFSRRMVVE